VGCSSIDLWTRKLEENLRFFTEKLVDGLTKSSKDDKKAPNQTKSFPSNLKLLTNPKASH
jgi:hypothetical protein